MRRIGVISDVHRNLPALERALTRVERNGCTEIWCLGDTFTCAHVLFGNHEEMVLDAETESQTPSRGPAPESPIGLAAAQLDERPEFVAVLARLRPLETIPVPGGDIVLAHGSPHRPVWHWVKGEDDVELAFRAAPYAQLLLVGHTHVAALGTDADGLGTPAALHVGRALPADGYAFAGRPALVNPGSVGAPPPGIRASCGILTLEDDGRPRRFDWLYL